MYLITPDSNNTGYNKGDSQLICEDIYISYAHVYSNIYTVI